MPETSNLVQFDLESTGVAVVTINRPEVRNALNWEAMRALGRTVDRAAAQPDLRAVILTGAGGRAFISGGDLRDLHTERSEEEGLRQHDLMTGVLDGLSALPVPVIAALEGATRGGGCEVALACDLRVAATDATFGFIQIRLGLTPGWGGAKRLIDAVGYVQALDLLVTGRVLDAEEALALRLVSRLCEPGQALATARAYAERIAQAPPLALRGVKEVLHGHLTLPEDAAQARERNTFGWLWATEDHAEASAAYFEKRPPTYRGR